jgi:hypothetical protein
MDIKNVITTDTTIVKYPEQNPNGKKGGRRGGKSK